MTAWLPDHLARPFVSSLRARKEEDFVYCLISSRLPALASCRKALGWLLAGLERPPLSISRSGLAATTACLLRALLSLWRERVEESCS